MKTGEEAVLKIKMKQFCLGHVKFELDIQDKILEVDCLLYKSGNLRRVSPGEIDLEVLGKQMKFKAKRHIHICVYFFFIFFSTMVYYRILNIVPCAKQ